FSAIPAPAREAGAARPLRPLAAARRLARLAAYPAGIFLAAAAITLIAEAIWRGSLADAAAFLVDPHRPGPGTVVVVTLALLAIDAVMRRTMQSVLVVAPILLALAWIGREKLFYLGDPPYPTDFLYARQIAELMPLMMAERPVAGALTVLGLIGAALAVFLLWRRSHLMPKVCITGRA